MKTIFERIETIEEILKTDKPMICHGNIYLKTDYVQGVLNEIKVRSHLDGVTKADSLLVSLLSDFTIPS